MITETARTGEFILSEANGARSRENITLASGAGQLQPGTVLGIVAASGEYVPIDPAATDGRETAAGILYDHADATSAAVAAAAMVRDAEIKADLLIWPDGITDAQKAAALSQLAATGIVAR